MLTAVCPAYGISRAARAIRPDVKRLTARGLVNEARGIAADSRKAGGRRSPPVSRPGSCAATAAAGEGRNAAGACGDHDPSEVRPGLVEVLPGRHREDDPRRPRHARPPRGARPDGTPADRRHRGDAESRRLRRTARTARAAGDRGAVARTTGCWWEDLRRRWMRCGRSGRRPSLSGVQAYPFMRASGGDTYAGGGAGGQAGGDLYVEVENVIGSEGDDTILGNARPNELVGGKGTDILYGVGGNDVLIAALFFCECPLRDLVCVISPATSL